MKHTYTRAPRFDREWKEMISLLPQERRDAFENSIREYQLNGTLPECLDGAEMMAFLLIKKIVDRRTRMRRARLRKKNPETSTPVQATCRPTKESSPATPPNTPQAVCQNPARHRDSRKDVCKRFNSLNARSQHRRRP